MGKTIVANLPTYIYIDGSNIRLACRKGCGFELDFKKLYDYFCTKYPNLINVQYFEGISIGDTKKEAIFNNYRNYGYEVIPLSRKSYTTPAKYKSFQCSDCGKVNRVKTADSVLVMKSNIDVLLCSRVMADVAKCDTPSHFVIVSCDGDYAEMICQILSDSPDVYVSVLSTPYQKNNNYLSIRYKDLIKLQHFSLLNILTIPSKFLPPNAPKVMQNKK